MIKYTHGDAVKSGDTILMHQVNCLGVMGAGIARQIKKTYPEVFERYKMLCDCAKDETEILLGRCQVCPTNDGREIFNLFGQNKVAHAFNEVCTDYKAFEEALVNAISFIPSTETPIAIPYKIGCGLAGGDWNVVSKIIEKYLSDYNVTIYDINGEIVV